MSVFQSRGLRCPCGQQIVTEVAVSLNGSRVPEVVDSIRAGQFQRLQCPACGILLVADGPLMYTDFDRKHWVGCFPRAWEGAWRVLEHQPAESFRRAMIELAAPAAREMAPGFEIRTTFGLPALAEKIIAWDHAIDDRLLELAKLELYRTGSGQLALDQRPRLVGVEGDELVLRAEGRGGRVLLQRRALDDLAAGLGGYADALHLLAGGPYVDLGRMVYDGDADVPRAAVVAPAPLGMLDPQA